MATQSLVKAETELAIVPAATPMGLLQTLRDAERLTRKLERMIAFAERVKPTSAGRLQPCVCGIQGRSHSHRSQYHGDVRPAQGFNEYDHATSVRCGEFHHARALKHGLSHSLEARKMIRASLEVTCTLSQRPAYRIASRSQPAPDNRWREECDSGSASTKSLLGAVHALGGHGHGLTGQDDDAHSGGVSPTWASAPSAWGTPEH